MQQDLLFVDTHAHIDGKEFNGDLAEVVGRARKAGVGAILVPSVDCRSMVSVMNVCRRFPNYCYPMIGLHPEEVKADWCELLADMKRVMEHNLRNESHSPLKYIAIGECGLDFYWSREFEKEQIQAFEEQVKWSIQYQLPLMIHCRKAQNEMLHVMKPYSKELPGGVFHCFTGNRREAEAFLQMERFCLGVGGVSTFKNSHLREELPLTVPLERIVLETDSPYMAPVPHRGKRNESAFTAQILSTLAESYGITEKELADITTANVTRIFGINVSPANVAIPNT